MVVPIDTKSSCDGKQRLNNQIYYQVDKEALNQVNVWAYLKITSRFEMQTSQFFESVAEEIKDLNLG